MNFGQLKNAVLGLMFSNTVGNRRVELTAASVQEYIINMPDAANSAFADIATVCPDVSEAVLELPLEQNDLSLNELFPRFLKLLESECSIEKNGKRRLFMEYTLHGNNKMWISCKDNATVTLAASCIPMLVDENTSDDTTLPFSEKALTAISYYMAHRLYLEDEISIAMHYLNMYNVLKEELAQENSRDGYGMGNISNKAGWL